MNEYGACRAGETPPRVVCNMVFLNHWIIKSKIKQVIGTEQSCIFYKTTPDLYIDLPHSRNLCALHAISRGWYEVAGKLHAVYSNILKTKPSTSTSDL